MKNNTYHIITIGCAMNIADSERLASLLDSKGFVLEKDTMKASVVIINTCGVRQSAEDRVYGIVNQVKKNNPSAKIVVTGCLSRRKDVQKRLSDRVDVFMPINEMLNLPQLLEGRVIKDKLSLDDIRLMQGEKYLTIIPKYESAFSAYIPIGNGCNNFCSYCVVPYARGREVYRPAKDILREIRRAIRNGYKEITLIAQNVNSYHDDNYDFADLLEEVIKIKGKFWIRFSSSHPKDMSDKLIKVLGSSDKVCFHLHLAVQSGDDDVLKAMNRNYTAQHYINLINKIRKAKPGISITTDAIVGFPGETKRQFNNTVSLFKKVGFDLAYIAQYSPRPYTRSYEMNDNVTKEEKKRREKVLTDVLRITALQESKKYLGKVVEVLVDSINKKGRYVGKTSTYKTVYINPVKDIDQDMIGKFIKVKINKVQDFGLEGNIVNKKSLF